MTVSNPVFDDLGAFCAARAASLQGRAKADLLMVAMDVIRGEPADAAVRLEGSERLAVRWVTGDRQLAGVDPLMALLGLAPQPGPDEPHPVDDVIDAGIAPDALVIVYAGVLEWESGLAVVKRIRKRLPAATLDIMACTCATDRKIELLGSFDPELGSVGIVFTPECGGEESMQAVATALAASAP